MTVRLLHYSDLEDVYDHPDRVGRLAGLIDERRGEDALVLGSGDDLAMGVLATVSDRGKREALAFFEAVAPDADAVGNHDLDDGPAAFLAAAGDAPVTWTCANLRADDGPFGRATVRQTAVLDAGGERVGVFGLAHPDTTEFAPAASDLDVTDPVDAAREAVATLRDCGVDHVVCLSHLGESERVARAVDVDAVLEGHHHERRVERVDDTPIARSAGNGRDLTELALGEAASVTVHRVEDGPLDESVAATYRRRTREAGLDEVVATVEDPIERTYATRFHGESRLGNAVADAYRWATGADLALFPGGGIRTGDPLAGEVTVRDLVGAVPHDDALVVCSVDGEALRTLFAGAADPDPPGDQRPWWHFQVGGARVVWDHEAAELVAAEVDGDPLRANAEYAVATTQYVLDYDGVPITDVDRVEALGPQYEHVLEYARECGLDPEIEGRIVRRNLPE